MRLVDAEGGGHEGRCADGSGRRCGLRAPEWTQSEKAARIGRTALSLPGTRRDAESSQFGRSAAGWLLNVGHCRDRGDTGRESRALLPEGAVTAVRQVRCHSAHLGPRGNVGVRGRSDRGRVFTIEACALTRQLLRQMRNILIALPRRGVIINYRPRQTAPNVKARTSHRITFSRGGARIVRGASRDFSPRHAPHLKTSCRSASAS